jgi:Flp pilus assembly protein TadG
MYFFRRLTATLGRLGTTCDGAAAIEFALFGTIFVVLLLNTVDFAFLIWSQMEVDYAAESGVQAAYNTCSSGTLPATTNCGTMNSVITTAAQSTSLGTSVTLASGYPAEGYYCTNGNTLQSVGNYNAKPNPYNCAAAGDASATPGDYVTVNVNYSFRPLFSGLSFVPNKTLAATGVQRLQ